MTAVLDVLLAFFTVVALGGLCWYTASAFTSWRYLRARRKKFGGLRIVYRRRAS